jgi:ABC-type uncharacterized transport system permease subunit
LIGVIVMLSMAFLGVIYPVLTATTVVESVITTVVPDTTYFRTYLVTRTLTEPGTTVTATGATQTTAQPTQTQPAVTITTTPAPGGRASQFFDPMTLGIFVAVAVAVVVGVLLGYRRGRY